MKQYILPALCELTSLEEYKDLLTSPKNADIVITGLIEKNCNNIRKQIQIITEVAAYIPQDLWFEYFFRCSRNANSHEEFKDAIKKALELIKHMKELAKEIGEESECFILSNMMEDHITEYEKEIWFMESMLK